MQIEGYPNYSVDCKGVVSNTRKGTILKQHRDYKGYYYVVLSNKGKPKKFKVHRLVALAFLPNKEKLPMVNHKDEDKGNNNLVNLEWCSDQYNKDHSSNTYTFLSPDREVVIIKQLVNFCKLNDLNKGHMYSVASGKKPSYKGWRLHDKT